MATSGPGAQLQALARDQRGRLIEIQIGIAFFLVMHAIFIPHLVSPDARRRLVAHVVLAVVWLGVTALAAALTLPSRARLGLSVTVWAYLLLAAVTFRPLLGRGPWTGLLALPLRGIVAVGLEAALVRLKRARRT